MNGPRYSVAGRHQSQGPYRSPGRSRSRSMGDFMPSDSYEVPHPPPQSPRSGHPMGYGAPAPYGMGPMAGPMPSMFGPAPAVSYQSPMMGAPSMAPMPPTSPASAMRGSYMPTPVGAHYTAASVARSQGTASASVLRPQVEYMSAAGSEQGDHRHPLGELFVDRTSPDSLAPWLLLLEKRAPFVVHEIDPRQRDQFAVPTNPSGVLPMWVDADTSCVWGASTVMRFVCDKHHLSPGAYAEEDFHRKTKTNMAIDWCANVLKPHIHRLVYPEQYDQTSSSSVENTKPVLHRDMKVLSEFFLADAQFIGGDAPDISDCYICMQLLLLYSTDFPPQNQVRQYLHATADKCDNWNEVTSGLRDSCARRQQELQAWVTEQEQKKYMRIMAPPAAPERPSLGPQEDQIRRDIETKCRNDVEEEIRRRDQDDMRRRELEDQELRAESQRRRAQMKEQFRKEEEQWRLKLIDQVSHQREEEERRWNEQMEAKRQEVREMERRLEDDERRRAEMEREQQAKRQREEEELNRSLASTRSRSRTPTKRGGSAPPVSRPRRAPQVGVEIKVLDDKDGNSDCVVVVHSVVPNTPAHKAGLKMDDIIESWAGEGLHSKADWTEKVKGARVGSTVPLTIVRNGTQMEIPVTIGSANREMGGVRKVASKAAVGPGRKRSPSPRSARSRSTGRR